MAGYRTRKGGGGGLVFDNLANLNEIIPYSQEDTAQEGTDGDVFFEDPLTQFTNEGWVDFDGNGFFEGAEGGFDVGVDGVGGKSGVENGDVNANEDEGKGIDFVHGSFAFPDIDTYLPPNTNTTNTTTPSNNPLSAHPNPTTYPSLSPTTNPLFNPSPYPGQKHPLASSLPHHLTSIEQPETPTSRLLAEEDKRRRNTAASARFRVKKKQREAALEQSAKELEGKTQKLEQRIVQLETENEWLRGLVVERHGGGMMGGGRLKGLGGKERGEGGGDEVGDEGKGEKREDGERSTNSGKKGVGTPSDTSAEDEK